MSQALPCACAKMTHMSSLTHHSDRGVIYVGPSLGSSLLRFAVALAAAGRFCARPRR